MLSQIYAFISNILIKLITRIKFRRDGFIKEIR